VNVQIFNGTTDTWGSVTEMTTGVANNARRGFDLTYESQSGDIMSVYCDGDADPSYRVWNGSSWSAPQTNATNLFLDLEDGTTVKLSGREARTLYLLLSKHYDYRATKTLV
jgi:hypothetical protein